MGLKYNSISRKYIEHLEALPPRGAGCHTALLGIANLGCMCGKKDSEILSDIRKAIKPGTGRVPDREIIEAIARARKDYCAEQPQGTYALFSGRQTLVREPSLAEKVSRLADGENRFRQRVFLQPDDKIGLPCLEEMIWQPADPSISSLCEVLGGLFVPSDHIFLGDTYASHPLNIRTVTEWINFLNLHGKLLDCLPAGKREVEMQNFCRRYLHICLNPLSGKAAPKKSGDGHTYRGDNCVAHFRYFIVESDSLPIAQQEALIGGLIRLGFPLKALVYSGGKSCHAWFKCVGIDSLDEWERTIKNRLFPLLALLGADKACANVARLSRTPGMFREDKGKVQKLLYLNLEEVVYMKTVQAIGNLEAVAEDIIGAENKKNVSSALAEAVVSAEAVAVKDVEFVPQPLEIDAAQRKDLSYWATLFFQSYCSADGSPLLLYWRNKWFIYEDHAEREVSASGQPIGVIWHEITEDDLSAKITRFLRENQFHGHTGQSISTSIVKSILCNLNSEGLAHLPSALEMPCFVRSRKNATGWLVTQNAAVNVGRLVNAQAGEPLTNLVQPLSPDLFCTYSVPYEFDPEADCPRFERFLQEVQPEITNQEQLQMLAGLLLIPETKYNVGFFLVGEAGTGKSVFADTIYSMLGKENVCSVPLTQVADRFRSIDLTTHLANICNDLSMGEGRSMNDITSIFKAITCGETIPTEVKYEKPGRAKVTARLVFTTNVLPRFRDLSKGVWDRMRIIPFNQRFRENPVLCGESMPDMRLSDGKIQDPNLTMTLRAELPGILNWAIRGLIRLQKYRTFPESRAGIQIKEDLQARSFPEIEFLQENFCASAGSVIPIQDIYDRYRNWALENGERAVTQSKLWDSLLRTFPQCTKARNRIAGFQRVYVHGIKLLAEDMAARAQHVTEPAPAIPIAPAPVAHTAAPGLPAALNDPKWLERMTAQSA